MYRLTAGKWEAVVYPECGMNLASLTCEGKPILRTPADESALRESLYLYGNPLLMPANRTKDGRFSFRDKTYQLPVNEPIHKNNLHGQMADVPFTVEYQTDNELCAVYCNRGERYPFLFDMTIKDTLNDQGWTRTIELVALEDMPYTLAFHTTFVAPQSFSVPIGQRYLCDANYIPNGQMVEAEPLGKVISGFYASVGHMVMLDDYVFTVSDNFDHWVLYNGSGASGFLCIEPQCGAVNGLNTPEHRTLGKDARETFTLSIGTIKKTDA